MTKSIYKINTLNNRTYLISYSKVGDEKTRSIVGRFVGVESANFSLDLGFESSFVENITVPLFSGGLKILQGA